MHNFLGVEIFALFSVSNNPCPDEIEPSLVPPAALAFHSPHFPHRKAVKTTCPSGAKPFAACKAEPQARPIVILLPQKDCFIGPQFCRVRIIPAQTPNQNQQCFRSTSLLNLGSETSVLSEESILPSPRCKRKACRRSTHPQ